MYKHQTQITADRVKFGLSHVLDLLDNVLPVHVIDPLASREAA
jgi:hypothetical protein